MTSKGRNDQDIWNFSVHKNNNNKKLKVEYKKKKYASGLDAIYLWQNTTSIYTIWFIKKIFGFRITSSQK